MTWTLPRQLTAGLTPTSIKLAAQRINTDHTLQPTNSEDTLL